MAASDVTFDRYKIARRKAFHVIAHAIDHADKFVTNGHGHGNRFLRPGVPIIYMYVGPADRRFQNPDQDIIALDFRDRNFLQPESRLRLGLYDCLHCFCHEIKLSADRPDSTSDIPRV